MTSRADAGNKVLIYDLDDTIFDSTNQPPDDGDTWGISVFPELQPVLRSGIHTQILVTRGTRERQERKIDVLGIRNYFSDIHIVDTDPDKHAAFKEILTAYPDSELVVIGNRRDCEIRYGNMLGFKTILVRHGRYEHDVSQDAFEIANHEVGVCDLASLHDYL